MTPNATAAPAIRSFRFWIAVVIVASATGAACRPATNTPEERTTPDQVVVSRSGRLERRLVLSGTLEAVNKTAMQVPQTTERQITLQWLAQDGSEIHRGETVAEFDPSPFSAKLEASRNQVLVAVRTLDRLQKEASADAEEADIEWERAQVAFAKAELDSRVPASLRSRQEHENAMLALEQARASLEKSEEDRHARRIASSTRVKTQQEDLLAARRELARAEMAMEVVRLTSPTDGILVVADHPWEGRRIQVGDSLWTGLSVAMIPDLSTLRIRAVLWDVDDGTLAPGMEAICTLDALPERHFRGRITDITPVAQEVRRFSLRRGFTVIILLEDVDPEATRPGMSVHVDVPLPAVEGAVLIPRSTIIFDTNQTFVRLADGTRVTVTLGQCSPQECTVTSGLEAGVELADRIRS